MMMSEPIRLQKYLAQCGVTSRRNAEKLISQGRVQVDGVTVTAMGIKIVPGKQIVSLDGKEIRDETEHLYILLNKPKGFVTTLSDPQGRPIVTSLIKDIQTRLFPVGRLDLDTEGALLLTNDGELAQKIQHPKFGVNKSYEAQVSGLPTKKNIARLERGILLDGKKTSRAHIRIKKKFKNSSLIKITIHEGRKRQVRKMFQAIGHPVIHLKRVSYGHLHLGNLPTGKYKRLNLSDIKKIFTNNSLQKPK